MTESSVELVPGIEPIILTVRRIKVILDADLARIYGVPTKRLNEQVRRNAERFPPDFMFQLTPHEVADLRQQVSAAHSHLTAGQGADSNRSQIATSSSRHRDPRYPPYAFTEHGAIMAANVLNSSQAVQMSVFVVRAFVRMREHLLSHAELDKRLTDIEKTLIGHDTALRDLYQKIRPLLLPPPAPPRKQIGFQVREPRTAYRVGEKLR